MADEWAENSDKRPVAVTGVEKVGSAVELWGLERAIVRAGR